MELSHIRSVSGHATGESHATVEVFISWSGEKSRAAAEEIALSLALAVPGCRPWISIHDIPSGARWSDELSSALGRCTAAVLVLTAENVTNPWVLFEAGAISKPIPRANVIPLLLDLDPSQLPAPLAQFQSERLNEAGFVRMCEALCPRNHAPTGSGEGIREHARETWLKFEPSIARIREAYKTLLLHRRARAHYVSHSEMKVLELVAKGLSPSQIAKENGVAVSTVRSQVMSLRHKLGASNVAEIIAFARQDELLE